VVSVNDDDGVGGTFSSSGGDSSGGGSPGRGGEAGDGGEAGFSGSGGEGGSDAQFPAPTCDAEPLDDECMQCFKRNCCGEWLGCDDQTCADEWMDVAECLEPQMFPGEDELGICISEASEANDAFVQSNTQALIDCALTPADDAGIDTLCSSECFGSDIFYE
jgi:hypothetical protein